VLLQDVRYSFRFLVSKPGFTVSIILALGIGIGANTAFFSVVNGLLLRPLPYQRPNELVEIEQPRRVIPLDELSQAHSFAGVATFVMQGFPILENGSVKNVFGFHTTPNLFQVLGVQAKFGRVFTSEDYQPTAAQVVLLSYDYWRRISSDPKIVGQSLTIGGEKYTILGVMPADFTLSVRDGDVFVPFHLTQGGIVARLNPGVSVAQAQAEATAIMHALPRQQIATRPPATRVRLLADAFIPDTASTVLLLQTALVFILLITCANAGNLLLVGANSRRKEFAIRAAIGAGRWRALRQLMTEGALLAILGGVAGLMISYICLSFLRIQLPGNISRRLRGAEALSIDHQVLAFTAGISLLIVFLFALAPALISMPANLMACLRESAQGSTPPRQRLGQILIVVEIGLALMLLIGTGLMLKSLLGLRKVNLGFSADHVFRTALDLVPSRYPAAGQKARVYTEITRRLETLPGVESVGVIAPQVFPFGGARVRGSLFQIFGRTDVEARAEVYTANPTYFRSVRIPLLKGRGFTDADNAESAPVAIISEIVANRYWKLDDPIGRRIRLNADRPDSPWVTIVGIAGDVRNPLALEVQPTAYRPFAQNPTSGAVLMIRTSNDPMLLTNPVRAELRAIDPTMPEFRVANLEVEVANYISPQRFTTSVLGFFAGVGLLLASAGVYGVMRYWVSARIPEIGVRMALGANTRDVFRLVMGKAAAPSLVGIVFGIAGALAVQKVMASELYGVSPLDPAVFAGVTTFMGFVALLAAFLPARSAARIDPMIALREE
jgi:putative ABC transport system permease protein